MNKDEAQAARRFVASVDSLRRIYTRGTPDEARAAVAEMDGAARAWFEQRFRQRFAAEQAAQVTQVAAPETATAAGQTEA